MKTKIDVKTRERVHAILKSHLSGLDDIDLIEGAKPLFQVDGPPDPGRYDNDSLDRVEVIMALEEEFGIDISDDEAESENFSTYDAIQAWMENKVGA